MAGAVSATLGSALPASWPGLLAPLALMAAALTGLKRPVAAPALVPVAISLWAAVQAVLGWTAYRQSSLEASLLWAGLGAAYIAGSSLTSAAGRERTLTGFAAFAGLTACFALFQPQLTGANPDVLTGPFPNRNHYACFAELSLAVIVWKASRRARWLYIWWAAAVVVIASVVQSGSRAGAAMIAAETVLLVCFLKPRARWGILAASGAACALFGSVLWTRLQYGDPFVYRREIYGSALRMIAERPLRGHGLGAFADAYPPYAVFDAGRKVNHAHNDWLQFAVEGGVLTLAAVAVFFAAHIRRFRGHLWAAGLPFFMAHAAVDYPFQRLGAAVWAFLLLGALHATAGAAGLAGDPQHFQARRRQPLGVEQIASV
jgi:O-antigen ligase